MTDADGRDDTTPRRRTAATRKRATGESSIYRDEDGRWHGFVSMGKENGRRDRRHVSAAKRADVVAKVRALEAKRDAGMVEQPGRHPPSATGWTTGWRTSRRGRSGRGRWRATGARSGCTCVRASVITGLTGCSRSTWSVFMAPSPTRG